MQFKRKVIMMLCMTAFMVFAWMGMASALPSDIQGHWAEQQISEWVNRELSSGYADGTFKPDNPITRAEFITLINRSFGFTASEGIAYSDVLSTDWFYNEIARAKAAGYISGYEDNTMRPDNAIVRQEVAAILVRLLAIQSVDETTLQVFHDAGAIQGWAKTSVAAMVKNGLMKGYPDQTFLPESPITRAEALVSLQRALDSRKPAITSGITGVVTQNGSPVKDATVRVYQAGSYDMLHEAFTDESGSYSVQLSPGKYDLTAVTAESVAYAGAIMVNDGEKAAGNLSLLPGTVASGTILDASGSKAAGAVVLFTTNPTFRAVTDSQGRYLIVLLPDHKYTVRLSQPGQSEDYVTVTDDLEVGPAGVQTIAGLDLSQASATIGGGGGGSAGAADTTAPKIIAASINISSRIYDISIASNGLSGSVNLSKVSGADKIVSGTINVSEESTLVLQMNALTLPVEPQKLTAGTNTLEVIKYLSILNDIVPDGDSLSSIRNLLGSSVTFEGTLTDKAGNVSHVSLTVNL